MLSWQAFRYKNAAPAYGHGRLFVIRTTIRTVAGSGEYQLPLSLVSGEEHRVEGQHLCTDRSKGYDTIHGVTHFVSPCRKMIAEARH